VSHQPDDDPRDVADWTRSGPPRSRTHGDVYFSAEDAVGESRLVFLEGCGLPQAWAGRRRFCVGELGFGAGRNVCALLDMWRRTSPPGARLHIFSIEENLIGAEEAARALGALAELGDVVDLLLARWPRRARGFRRIDIPQLRVVLDLAMMEAEPALEGWGGKADAWFLDGFSPAADPRAWRPQVMRLVAAKSAPGARAATYTVAGPVREALADAGFEVMRRPGHGRKRERLEARLAGPRAAERTSPRIAVIGAGIAGASLARALRDLGASCRLFDIGSPGAGASGAPAVLAAPRLDAGLGPIAALFAQASARANALYLDVPHAVLSQGVVQLPVGERDTERFATIARSDLFEAGAVRLLGGEDSAAMLGEPARAGLFMAEATALDPAPVLAAWCGSTEQATVGSIELKDGVWRLLDPVGGDIAEFEVVCLAAGPACTRLLDDIPLVAVRGQSSVALNVHCPVDASFAGQVIDTPAGTVFGSTHDRGDLEAEPRDADDARNLATVAKALPRLAERLAGAPTTGWAAVRAASPDYLPLAGAVEGAPGLYLFTALGSRGFTLAPLLGEHLAALILNAPSPLAAPLADLVDPARFARRAARRGRPAPARALSNPASNPH
jgi:tRNA 5-methylaminomethyl-2-thiouridine biosynthesis bifunctional protein